MTMTETCPVDTVDRVAAVAQGAVDSSAIVRVAGNDDNGNDNVEQQLPLASPVVVGAVVTADTSRSLFVNDDDSDTASSAKSQLQQQQQQAAADEQQRNLWSLYRLHRDSLAASIVRGLTASSELESCHSQATTTMAFVTTTTGDKSDDHMYSVGMGENDNDELGNDSTTASTISAHILGKLGDENDNDSNHLTQIAYTLFNVNADNDAAASTDADAAAAAAVALAATLERRRDFAALVSQQLLAMTPSSSGEAAQTTGDHLRLGSNDYTVTFSMRHVTISNQSTLADDAEIDNKTEHRAVLIVQLSPMDESALPLSNNVCQSLSPVPSGSAVKLEVDAPIDELDAPCDELNAHPNEWVEREPQPQRLTKSNLTALLLQQVESTSSRRTVSFKDFSMDETLNTTAPSTPQSTCEIEHPLGSSPSVSDRLDIGSARADLADQFKTVSMDSATSSHSKSPWRLGMSNSRADDDYDAPHDELNASSETATAVPDTTRLSPSEMSPTLKKKKKPKPVFELPEKLFAEESFERELSARLVGTSTADVSPAVVASAATASVEAPAPYTLPVGLLLNDDSLLPAPIAIVRTATYDNTVTSALTGPFYIDDQGNVRDVFEHTPESDPNAQGQDDDDTRAQARRHEWIQTALLNHGIGERMETLLQQKEPDESTLPTLASLDPWEWISGFNVCEFSRSLIKSVKEYANGIGVDLGEDPDQTSTPTEEENVGTNEKREVTWAPTTAAPNATAANHAIVPDSNGLSATTPAAQSIDNRDVRNPGTTAKDRLRKIQAMQLDEQSREDLAHLADCNIELIDDSQHDSVEECSGSQNSKDSPRGVQTFDTIQTDVGKPSNPAVASTHVTFGNRGDSSALVTQAETVPKRKTRGIKALFRRRKVDF